MLRDGLPSCSGLQARPGSAASKWPVILRFQTHLACIWLCLGSPPLKTGLSFSGVLHLRVARHVCVFGDMQNFCLGLKLTLNLLAGVGGCRLSWLIFQSVLCPRQAAQPYSTFPKRQHSLSHQRGSSLSGVWQDTFPVRMCLMISLALHRPTQATVAGLVPRDSGRKTGHHLLHRGQQPPV